MKIKFNQDVVVQDAKGGKYSINETTDVENEMAEYFIKEKLAVKAGETDKPEPKTK